jgi:hypothetical protein
MKKSGEVKGLYRGVNSLAVDRRDTATYLMNGEATRSIEVIGGLRPNASMLRCTSTFQQR